MSDVFFTRPKNQKVAGVSGNWTPAISGKSAVGEIFLHLARMDRDHPLLPFAHPAVTFTKPKPSLKGGFASYTFRWNDVGFPRDLKLKAGWVGCLLTQGPTRKPNPLPGLGRGFFSKNSWRDRL